MRQLVRTLAVVVTRWPEPVNNEGIRDALRRVVGEMSKDGVPNTLAQAGVWGALFRNGGNRLCRRSKAKTHLRRRRMLLTLSSLFSWCRSEGLAMLGWRKEMIS